MMSTKPDASLPFVATHQNLVRVGVIVLTASIGGIILGVLVFSWVHRNDELIEITLEDDDTISFSGKHLPTIQAMTASSTTLPIAPRTGTPTMTRPVELPTIPRNIVWKAAATVILYAVADDLQLVSAWLNRWLQGAYHKTPQR